MLDDLDRHILELVQKNNLATHRELAELVNLSVPAVARRLQDNPRAACAHTRKVAKNHHRMGTGTTSCHRAND